MLLGSAFQSFAMLLLPSVACFAAPLDKANDSAAALPESVASWNVPSDPSPAALSESPARVATAYPKSISSKASARSAPAPEWKGELGRKEQSSIVAPVMGTALGAVVVALGMLCSSSTSVQNAFSSNADAGHKAAVVTGSGIMLGGAAIVSVSLVQLGKAL